MYTKKIESSAREQLLMSKTYSLLSVHIRKWSVNQAWASLAGTLSTQLVNMYLRLEAKRKEF
jgi:hypothetical protein